ncbi:MAG: dienelactone hydrolase family protein [Aridibacter famidurans]|nr:dienelactone hydrolase family protein [Aridibacter famidurans]
MDQKYIDLYDEYIHGTMPRRKFVNRLAKMAGGMAAAALILPVLENNMASAKIVDPDDKDLKTSRVEYDAATGKMKAYLARPAKQEGKLPGVLVIHENRGLNAHIEDVTRRAAKAGFIALAPDALSPLGGTPEDQDKARGMFGQLDRRKTIENFVDGVEYLKSVEGCSGKIGCVGFCWGGSMANQLAVNSPDMKAAVAFYGSQAAVEDVPKIKGKLMLHYAENDQRINAGIEAYEKALKEAKVDYESYMYEGVGHAFHNDTSEARYNEEAAKLAWSRTVEFWNKHLKGK